MIHAFDTIDVSQILVPDDNYFESVDIEQEKFPVSRMKSKLEDIFQGKAGFNKDTIEGAYTRVIILFSMIESSVMQFLERCDEKKGKLYCPECKVIVSNMRSAIDHLTSEKCGILERHQIFGSSVDKKSLNNLLQAARIARNALVHRLEISNVDMKEIEGKFREVFQLPYVENRWEMLSHMMTHIYVRTQHSIISAAEYKKQLEREQMSYLDYVSKYSNDEIKITNCVVQFSESSQTL